MARAIGMTPEIARERKHHERHAVVADPLRDEEDDGHRDDGEDDDDVGRHGPGLCPGR